MSEQGSKMSEQGSQMSEQARGRDMDVRSSFLPFWLLENRSEVGELIAVGLPGAAALDLDPAGGFQLFEVTVDLFVTELGVGAKRRMLDHSIASRLLVHQ